MIVLDAVGAGALPDAAEFGDEGSDTLGNVARAVGGLDLPNLEALGLGNVEALEGCPPQPGAPAVAGRLIERSKGKDTTIGHWELMGDRHAAGAADLPARLPARRDRPVHAPHRPRRDRQQARVRAPRSSRSSARSTRRPASGSSTRRPTPSSRSPRTRRRSRSRSCTRPAANAREILTGKHAVGRVIARPFVGEPGNYERTPNRHDFSLEPRTPELPDPAPRGGRHRPRRRQDRRHLRRRGHRREPSDEVERRGDPETEELLQDARVGLRLRQPRRDRHALGPPKRPGQLPPLPAGLRPSAARPARRAPARRPPRSSPPITAATRPPPAPTTHVSTRCCSPTPTARTRTGSATTASSPTSGRR